VEARIAVLAVLSGYFYISFIGDVGIATNDNNYPIIFILKLDDPIVSTAQNGHTSEF
jgi:hypothetical protein